MSTNATSQPPAQQPLTYRGDSVPRRRVIELSLEAPRIFENPLHDAQLVATLTNPSGHSVTWNGFWDGGTDWRLRYSPDEEGVWNYQLELRDADGIVVTSSKGSFTVLPALNETIFDRHGAVRVADDKRNLVHADGTPFFWMGDTAWNGPLRSTDDEWEVYLSTRVRQGFSAVQWVATQWRSSLTDIEGNLTFTGSERIQVNPTFFQRLDGKVESMTAANLLNVPVMLWAVGHGANPNVDPGYGLPEEEATLLARYQVARWGAYPVVWILAGDGRYFGDFAARWRRIGRATFGDQPHAPVAMHCGGEQWPADELRDEPWIGILGYQSGHGDSDKTLNWIVNGPPATEWNKEPRLFQINFEPAYENHVAYHSRLPHTPHSVRTAIYWSLLNAPTAGVTYGGHGVWGWDDGTTAPADHPSTGVPLPWRQALTMPAAEQVQNIISFFTTIEWWTLSPAQSLLLNQPGTEDVHHHISVAADDTKRLVVAYAPMGDEIRLDGAKLGQGHTGQWANPRTGERQKATPLQSAGTVSYQPPDNEDWLLLLRR